MQIPESPHVRKLLSVSEMIDRHAFLDSFQYSVPKYTPFIYYFLKNTILLNPAFYIFVNIFFLNLKKTHTHKKVTKLFALTSQQKNRHLAHAFSRFTKNTPAI